MAGVKLKPEAGPRPARPRGAQRATRAATKGAAKRAKRRWPKKTAKRAGPPPTRFLAAAAKTRPNPGEADRRGTLGRRQASRFAAKPKKKPEKIQNKRPRKIL